MESWLGITISPGSSQENGPQSRRNPSQDRDHVDLVREADDRIRGERLSPVSRAFEY